MGAGLTSAPRRALRVAEGAAPVTAPGPIRLQIWGTWAHPPPPMEVGLLRVVQPKNKNGTWSVGLVSERAQVRRAHVRVRRVAGEVVVAEGVGDDEDDVHAGGNSFDCSEF